MTVLKKAEALLPQLTDKETEILLRHIYRLRKRKPRGIAKRPGVCGGRACIEGTRMPVWSLVNHRLLGFTEWEILYNFPNLTPQDIKNAWAYYKSNKAEIDRDIQDNEWEDEKND
ncbi:MAG TPA: DUF433 domain-containing protein [Bacteroidetes bacterium]|nr:DUF433 domain-containing protein [Bacteroidota bacterium]